MAEPARMLLVSLCFLLLFFRLRRLAGMAAAGGAVRRQSRRAAVMQTAETAAGGTQDAGEAIEVVSGTPEPDIRPPQVPDPPIRQMPAKIPPYGVYLLRLIQQPEMRALLEKSPQLKPSLRRLLFLLGAEIPPELAPAPRLKQPNQPEPLAPTRRAPERRGQGATYFQAVPKRLTPSPLDPRPRKQPPSRLKEAGRSGKTRALFITINQQNQAPARAQPFTPPIVSPAVM